MNKNIKSFLLAVILITGLAAVAHAQGFDPEYVKVTNERADKILENMDIADPQKADKVSDIIAKQYRNLSLIHDERDSQIDAAKEMYDGKKEEKKIKKAEKRANKAMAKLHKKYLAQLSAELTDKQVEAVKDGMTYNVAPNTFKVYQEMIPDLNQAQQDKIWDWLVEARERAMDAGSSHAKHAWFGKYKGKINNYLSDLGYDLKQAEKEMFERKKAANNP
ncbi:DUF3826 domain-containing protein [Echinicola vietnamensis]|uniref:DUF3826 domain-containing protein n=1 Tax=Echinicola vietnamensis (strain DSM 17526 / LMG 23754 / KMM 6221) TaxID=926556 RepID=L0FWS4_ECHVK|nr:DUF3826 domain-containing protein [Echinicola vietnamensis]AGA77206.1 hypothetical protein Echvi_0933 [Echinicola vietnamensis DSM 17526]